jgi:hypothetical protein
VVTPPTPPSSDGSSGVSGAISKYYEGVIEEERKREESILRDDEIIFAVIQLFMKCK